MQSTPSDITDGTKGGSSKRNVQSFDEQMFRGFAAVAVADGCFPRLVAVDDIVPKNPAPPDGLGITPTFSKTRFQTLNCVSPSQIIPLSIEYFHDNCPKFFMCNVISSPDRTVNWCGGRAVALYMLDMVGMVVVVVGGRRPNFTVHPPLSTMQMGNLFPLLPVDIFGTEKGSCGGGEDCCLALFDVFLDGEDEDEPTASFRFMAIVNQLYEMRKQCE
jgi:hypothetical protein